MSYVSGNVINTIQSNIRKYGEINSLLGFYMLDIVFNSKPYYIVKTSNGYAKSSYSSLKGHYFSINDNYFVTGDNGIYHIESNTFFEINSLIIYGEDVSITYHIKTQKLSNKEIEDVILPKNYEVSFKANCEEKILTPAINTELLSSTYKGVDIEAAPHCLFSVNGNEIRIGETEHFIIQDTVTSIKFLGYYKNNILIRSSDKEVHLYLYM